MRTQKSPLSRITIPAYVSSWTHEYFHKSAFDLPSKYPSARLIKFLSKFRKGKCVKLYRGINEYNEDNTVITSWTYHKNIAKRYVREGGRIIKKEFTPDEILFDTTTLNVEQRALIGYDYEVDDREVLVILKKSKNCRHKINAEN